MTVEPLRIPQKLSRQSSQLGCVALIKLSHCEHNMNVVVLLEQSPRDLCLSCIPHCSPFVPSHCNGPRMALYRIASQGGGGARMYDGAWCGGEGAIAEVKRERGRSSVYRKSIGSASIRTRYPPSAYVQSTQVKEPRCITGDVDVPAD